MKNPSEAAVLVTISGPDKPGITSELTGVLSQANAHILDIGQAVIHGLLSLSILFELPPEDATDKTTIKDLLFKASELGVKLEFRVLDSSRQDTAEQSFRYAITLFSKQVTASSLHEVTKVLADFELNIDSIQKLSEREFGCVELLVSSVMEPDQRNVQHELLRIAKKEGVDIALQSEGLFRRAKRLIVMDMDSTLIQNEVIDEFARESGAYDDVAKITQEAMEGKIDFDESLTRRCAKLKGLSRDSIDKVYSRIQLTEGAEELIPVLKKMGYKIALISGGFNVIAQKLKDRLGIDYVYANQLVFSEDKLTGEIKGPIVNAERKADLLEVIAQQENISLDQVVAIGDGANDLLMLERAGLGIAFNAKAGVDEKADLSLKQRDLRSIFHLLGFSGRDLKEVLGKT